MDLTPDHDGKRFDSGWLVVIASVVVLVVLSMHDIAAKSFWWDEAVSLTLARMSPDRLAAALAGSEGNGTLYYALLSVWRLLGEGETRIDPLSVLLMAATIPVLYLVGRRHVGAAAAATGCVLFAVNPFVITYAQEARMYALAVVLATASVLAWSLATESDRARWWAAYAILGAAALYAHLFCGFVVVGLGIVWLTGLVPRTRAGLLAQGVIVVAGLPLAAYFLTRGFANLSWILPISDAGITTVLGAFGGASIALAWLLYGAAISAIPGRDPRRLRSLAPLVAWWLTPLVLGIGISIWNSLLEPRYFIVALPALVLLAGAGFVRIGSAIGGDRLPIPVTLAGVGLAIVLAIAPLTAWYASPRWDWRAAADWVARSATTGDRIAYIPDKARIPFQLYLDRSSDRQPSGTTIDAVRTTGGRTWLVLYLLRDVQYDGLEATFPGYQVVESKLFDGVRVQLIERQ